MVQTLCTKCAIRTLGQLVFEVALFIKKGFMYYVVSGRYDYEEFIKPGERKHRGETSSLSVVK